MAIEQQDNQLQFLLTDLSTRIRDIEERNNSMRERLMLLGQNLLDTRQKVEEKLSEIEKQNSQINSEIKKMKSLAEEISSEMNNFVRKDEIILVERMLKDFQPLEFMRRKDVEEMFAEMKKQLNPSNLHFKIETEVEDKEEQPIKTKKTTK